MGENNVARSRWIAIGFGALAFLTLTSFVYAFVQQAEARKQEEFARKCQIRSMEMIEQIELQRKQAEQALNRAQEEFRYSEAMRLKVESELKKK